MSESRPVAIVANASHYVGPSLARELAKRGFDLVLGDPAEGLVEEVSVPPPPGSSVAPLSARNRLRRRRHWPDHAR